MPSNRLYAILMWVLLWLGLMGSTLAVGKQPNILLILTDDQGWGDLHSHGNDPLDTPNLDRLAEQGARFDRFYVHPVCAPTRAAMLTGRYPLRGGVHGVTRAYETLRSEEVTIAEILKSAGYATGGFGKWHNGAHYPHHPLGQGFDEFFGFCAGHWNTYFDPVLEHNGQPIQTRGYITDVLTDAAMRFIEANRKRPFFCYIPFNAPHSPWQVPDKYFDKYKARGLDDTTACAYGMIENLDENIARLLAKLDELKLSDDTVVVFFTDNGPNSDRYNGEMRGRKGSVDEGGVRVPCFVRWPSHIPRGTKIAPIAGDVDLLPTLLDLCGVNIPTGLRLDGQSLAPLLKGLGRDPLAEPGDRMMFTHWSGSLVKPQGGAVRTQRWLATFVKQWQLYDMHSDPLQRKDIAGDDPQELSRLKTAYEQWFSAVTRRGFDPIPTEIGHKGWDRVELYGHEAQLVAPGGLTQAGQERGIRYFGHAGWAHEWITGWTDTKASAHWPIKVVRQGRYRVSVLYACAANQVGTKIRVDVGGHSLEAAVAKVFDSPLKPLPDRVKRAEAAERDWAEQVLGETELPIGQADLVVRMPQIPGPAAIDLKAVRLTRVK